MTRPRYPLEYLRPLRRIVSLLVVAGIGYLFWRFDLVTLPAGSQSGLVEVPAGSRIWLDARSASARVGDLVLFRGPDGLLRLGRVASFEEQGELRWYSVENDAGDDQRVAEAALAGRVLFVWDA